MIIPLWTAQGGSLLGRNAKSFFPRAPTYQHRKNNDVKIEDVSYNIHTTSNIRKKKKILKNKILVSQRLSFGHIYPTS